MPNNANFMQIWEVMSAFVFTNTAYSELLLNIQMRVTDKWL